MRAGLHFWNFTTPDQPETIPRLVADAARAAEDAGFDQFTVMDHWFQMEAMGPASDPMLEAFTTLGFVAAQTSRIRIGPLVAGVTYRHPGLLAKTATTLDVLSAGRSVLGLGAAWYEREHNGLGVPYPELSERFERLEEALQIVRQMWSDDDDAFEGRHYRLAETLSSPQPIAAPHPPILVGGKGERKTMRLAAKYAQIVNITTSVPDDVARLLDALRRHCDDVGTDYDAIEKQAMAGRLNPDAQDYFATIERLASLGIDLVVLNVRPNAQLAWIEKLSRDVIPRLRDLTPASP